MSRCDKMLVNDAMVSDCAIAEVRGRHVATPRAADAQELNERVDDTSSLLNEEYLLDVGCAFLRLMIECCHWSAEEWEATGPDGLFRRAFVVPIPKTSTKTKIPGDYKHISPLKPGRLQTYLPSKTRETTSIPPF